MANKKKGKAITRTDFTTLLADVKGRIQAAHTRAVRAVNTELVRLYWDIGRIIDQRQQREGWGSAVIPRLARELHNELPDLKGFSERNIDRMIAFFRAYPEPSDFSPQPVAKLPDSLIWSLPWAHHVILMQKVKDLSVRRWYMEQTLANGWSRNVLATQIASQAHTRQGKAVTNFDRSLPSPQSDLARQALKDPYIFDFLTLTEPFQERELETSLFGHGHDQPTIGLILCQGRNRVLAEYSLAGIDKPIGVSTYELTRALPAGLQSALPTVEQIEAELAGPTASGEQDPTAEEKSTPHRRRKGGKGAHNEKQ